MPFSGGSGSAAAGTTYVAQSFPNVKADGATDDTAALNTAIALLPTGSTVDFGSASYKVNALLGKSQTSFIGQGANLIYSGGAGTTRILDLLGTVTGTSTTLTANAAVGITALAVTSSAGFTVGDFVVVYDVTYKVSTNGRNQEINRILSIPDGTHITLAERAIGSYATASTAAIAKLAAIVDLNIRGLNFIVNTGDGGGCIYGTYCWSVNIDNCLFAGMSGYPGVRFDQSAACRVNVCRFRDGQNLATVGYGVLVGESCHHILIDGCHFQNIRENLFTANARYSSFVNNTIISPYDTGINTHGSGCEQINICGNLITSSGGSAAITIGWSIDLAADIDVNVTDNIIIWPQGDGIDVGGATGHRKLRINIANNIIRGFGSVGSGGYHGIDLQICDYANVHGNIIDGSNSNFATEGIYLNGVTFVSVKDNKLLNMSNAYGIYYTGCDSIEFSGNSINAGSDAFHSVGSNTNITIHDNTSPSPSSGLTLGASDIAYNNRFGNVPAFKPYVTQSLSMPVTAVANTDFTMKLPAGSIIDSATVYTTTAYGAVTDAKIQIGSTAGGLDYVAGTTIKAIGLYPLTLLAAAAASLLSIPAGTNNVFVRIVQTGTASATGAATLVVKYSSAY